MSGQELVAELRLYADQAEIADNAESDFSRTQNRAADRIEALEAAVDTWTEMAARRHRALGEVEASYREAIARAERAEQKSAELAAAIAEIRAAWDDVTWQEFGRAVHRILNSAPADVLSAYTTRIREEALAAERAAGALATEAACENAWREGYYTGKRDYAGSLMGGASISTENPYYAARIRSEIPEGQN